MSFVPSEPDVVDKSASAPASADRNTSVEDAALLTKLLPGAESAFTHLVRHHHASLIRVAMTYVADRHVTEEVVQETWLAVLNGLSAFECRSTLKSWIFSILTNRAKTRAVREKRSIPLSDLSTRGFDDEPSVDPDRFTDAGSWAEPPRRWDKNTPEQLMLRHEARAGRRRGNLRAAPEPTGRRHVARRRGTQRRVIPLGSVAGDDGRLYASSYSLLMAHEDKTFPGAMIASMSIP
jgi:RNA polymerase sigma-70 factor (ECF subfamily)